MIRLRLFSSSSSGERLRVAVVGGGAAGLSSALHLAPLVTRGLIAGPIDVYEPDCGPDVHNRDIGVGVWSTALDAFHPTQSTLHNKPRVDSHELVYQDFIKKATFIKEVGYRSPKGHWLAQSTLGDAGDIKEREDMDDVGGQEPLPQLLFLREKDLLATLRKAVHLEENRGTINLKTGKNYNVHSILEDGLTEPWSAPLLLQPKDSPAGTTPTRTERDYHLIVAADGMNSVLRKVYGGHIIQRRILTGTYAIGDSDNDSPTGIPSGVTGGRDAVNDWYLSGQSEATSTQDRHYTVFRGNAPIKRQDMPGELDISFQTWGEGRNMRFATVPMGTGDDEKQVWFITIDDDSITLETDPTTRRDMLLKAFAGWHAPIADLVKATPPNEILMERALAHKHSMRPVDSFYRMVHEIKKKPVPSYGQGPVIQFVGDAYMTIDPILAQGLTMGMEGAASLGVALSNCLDKSASVDNLAFDPYALRKELQHRHDLRLHRLIHLLRATELVQALGQPTSGTLSGLFSRDIIRPLMRITPSFIKTPIFNAMMMYSLGLHMTLRRR